jgi:hypothetical protein
MKPFFIALGAFFFVMISLILTWISIVHIEKLIFGYIVNLIAIIISAAVVIIFCLINYLICLAPIKSGVKKNSYLWIIFILLALACVGNIYDYREFGAKLMPGYIYIIIQITYIVIPMVATITFKKWLSTYKMGA